jgi:alpha-mannosidase
MTLVLWSVDLYIVLNKQTDFAVADAIQTALDKSGEPMKKNTLHMIGNAHIDPVWLWSWQEGYGEVKASFASALDRLDEYDDFYFTASSSQFFEWIEECDKEMFNRIKHYVSRGRIELTGGFFVEPDMNLPCGESFARQALLGQRYFKEKLGTTARVGYNIDSFGHNAAMPQILKKCGLDYYACMRPAPEEMLIEDRLFWWQSPDGSRVLSYRIPYEYRTFENNLKENSHRLLEEDSQRREDLMLFFGVGNHGGGPTIKNIEEVKSMDIKDVHVKMSRVQDYFDKANRENIPTVKKDLQYHGRGCYSVHSPIKRLNRQSENRLIRAEKFCTAASQLGLMPYPAEDLTRAWKGVLFNQFHDILAGTSTESACNEAEHLYGEVLSLADRAANRAVQSISWKIDIEQDTTMKPLVVFNPHGFNQTMIIEREISDLNNEDFNPGTQRICLKDSFGHEIPVQKIQSEATLSWQSRIVFTAPFNSFGYELFKLYSCPEPHVMEAPENPLTTRTLCSDRFSITLGESGYISSIIDKRTNREFLNGQGALLSIYKDGSDTWGHDKDSYTEHLGDMQVTQIKLLEEGPVRSTIKADFVFGETKASQEYRVYQNLDYVEVKTKINFQEKGRVMKIRYQCAGENHKALMEIPYGFIERERTGNEEPGQAWIDMFSTRDNSGLALANDSKYAYSFIDNEMAITAVRNAVFAHHKPTVLDGKTDYAYTDTGIQEISHIILPHEGDFRESSIMQVAQVINQSPICVIETYHKGTYPQKMSFLQSVEKGIMVRAVKNSEDGLGIILRFMETDGREREREIDFSLMEREFPLVFSPYEIKTIYIPFDRKEEIREVTLTEY